MAIDTRPANLRRHAYELAAAFDVTLIETDIAPESAAAHAGFRAVVIHPIIDETTYAVALHEIGHLVAPLGALRAMHDVRDNDEGNLKRIEEAAAWEWARHYALLWSDVMQHVATWAEGTYATATAVTPPAPVAPNQRINWKDWK